MKKKFKRFKVFSRRIRKGMAVEYKETKEIPKLLANKEYKKAFLQLLDIVKMTLLGLLWLIPGGAVLTALLIKFSHKMRPSAFRDESS